MKKVNKYAGVSKKYFPRLRAREVKAHHSKGQFWEWADGSDLFGVFLGEL